MKKALSFIALALLLAANAPAQDRSFSSGLGMEANVYSENGTAGGFVMAGDFTFLKLPFAVGISLAASTNGKGNGVLEPQAMFRWYFLSGMDGFFAQADLGLAAVMEEGESKTNLLTGLRAGYRWNFLEAAYLEPYGRFGYPFFWGLGLMMGLRY
jgi:hypothetical protein